MAMTKKEKARMEELERELRIAKALRFTDRVEPDVMPPDCGSGIGIKKGFLFNAYFSPYDFPQVQPACTSASTHDFGRDDKTRMQGSRQLYSTRLLAWRACRNEIEKQAALFLARIDALIEQEGQTHE